MTEMTKMTSNPFHCIAALKIAYKSNSTRLATHETQEHVEDIFYWVCQIITT